MTENQIQAVRIDDQNYALSDLSQEAREVVATIAQNQKIAQFHEANFKQLSIASAALQNALKEMVSGVTPIADPEKEEEPAAPVTITED